MKPAGTAAMSEAADARDSPVWIQKNSVKSLLRADKVKGETVIQVTLPTTLSALVKLDVRADNPRRGDCTQSVLN